MVEFSRRGRPESRYDAYKLLLADATSSENSPVLSLSRASRHDYAVRGAFLRSYQFSVRESVAERLRRSLRELTEAGGAVISEAFEWVFDGRVRARVYRVFRRRLAGTLGHVGCFSARKHCCLDDFI